MKTPILETERLLLRPMTANDSEEVFRNWASDAKVAKFMRWSTHENVEVTRQWLESEEKEIESEQLYDWGFVLKETGELIGSGGLSWVQEKGMYELGYNIMRKYWNQGLTTEAAKEIVRFGLEELKAEKLYCCHAKENPASGRVMVKAGFQYWKDAVYSSWDHTKTYECKEYILTR